MPGGEEVDTVDAFGSVPRRRYRSKGSKKLNEMQSAGLWLAGFY